MDTKRLLVGLVLSMGIFFGWLMLTQYLDRTHPAPSPQAQGTRQTPSPVPTTAASQSSTAPSVVASTSTQPGTGALEIISNGNLTAGTVNLGSAARNDPQFAMQLRTDSIGASVDAVVLNKFLKSVEDPKKEPYVFQQADPASLELYGRPLATRAITVDEARIDLTKATWKLERKEAQSVTYSLTLGHSGTPTLKVLKTYRIFKRDDKEHPGLGYEIALDYSFENYSAKPITIRMEQNGPALPPRDLLTGPDQRVMAGYPSGGKGLTVENHYVESLKGDSQNLELAVKEKTPAFWVGGSTVYFQAIMMPPLLPDGTTTSVKSFKAEGLNPEAEHQPVELTMDTADMIIGANQRLIYPISVYFGPKAREVLTTPYYASIPRHYDQALVVRSGPCSYCTFDWLINILVAMLAMFHAVARDWGLAIICLVLLVRLALHPITKRSQVSMMKMGKMAPEMKRLQEKYKDDKEALQRAMWQFQKQQGFTPVLGCLPMFLQMPIWIALWSALNTTFELRHSSFLWGLTWIDDLAKPDRLIPFPSGWNFRIPLIGTVIDALNVLPLLLAVVFYLQQKYTPKPPTMTKEQEQQQKIMQTLMIFLFPLFLYGQPSGLNLYILTSTAIGIWESKRIRAHIKEKEEQEKAGLVIVDAEPSIDTGKNKKGGKGGPGAAKAPQGGWLARKLAELQAKAEEARRHADRRKG